MGYPEANQLVDHKQLKKLSNAAGYFGLYLANKIDSNGQWQISRARIREETGRNNAYIAKAIKELEEAGLIVAHRVNKRAATQYFWAFACPRDCEADSHRLNGKRNKIRESPKELAAEWPSGLATESPGGLATNTSVNRPIKKERDLQEAGSYFLSLLKKQLEPLLDCELPARHYQLISKAIEETPGAVEELLEEKLKRADYPESYLDKVLSNTPWSLVPKKSAAKSKSDLRQELAAPVIAEITARAKESEAARTGGLSGANKAWLGSRTSHYAIRYAQVATELGIEIPEGLDIAEAGQLVAKAKEKTSGGVLIS
jgi:hypothetical protein